MPRRDDRPDVVSLWIAVDKRSRCADSARELLLAAEDEIRREDGRLLLIETSSLPHYEPTRRFYLKHGYDAAAAHPDYYADGDDLLSSPGSGLPPGTPPG